MLARSRKLFPGRIAILSFSVALLIGTLLLALPGIHHAKQLSLFESFFMATSALAVTGLEVVPFHEFSLLGQAILLFLIQLGGLGIATISLIAISMFVDMGLSVQSIASEILDLEHVKNIKHILLFIASLAFTCELIAIIPLYFSLSQHYPPATALRLAVFHSVSSFCNAGINIFPHDIKIFQTNTLFLSTTGLLVFIGGTGFFVWHNILQILWAKVHGIHSIRLTLHSRIVLWMTFWLIFAGALLFWVFERDNSLKYLTPAYQVLNALFSGISMRSTGFLTVATEHLHRTTLFLILLVSFIGSAPGSTGSGIKVTTFALILATVRSVLNGDAELYAFKRSIYRTQLMKALTIFFLSLFLVCIIIFCLLSTEREWSFFEIALESFSAYANLGLSLGITPFLSSTGRALIALCMFVGRAGILTVIYSIIWRDRRREFHYPEEHLLLT